MSVGPLSSLIAGSAAGLPMAQTHSDSERVQQHVTDAGRRRLSEQKATAAAGIGLTDAEHETSDRDADGRRLWEEETPRSAASPLDEVPASASRDATGTCGTQLDLQG